MSVLLLSLALQLNSPHASSPGRESRWDALVGWYELEPGRHALVTFGASGGLRLFDFETPSFDQLLPQQGRFDWRRQHDPGPAVIEFQSDAAGKATGFTWSAGEAAKGVARRDPPFGYAQAEVRFQSGDAELCGLLMLPLDGERHPGVVIVQGSGDSDRDNVWAFSIANHLALAGSAVLLPDKRGSGQSQGDWKAVGFDALALDALAGIELLAARPEVDAARVGLVGLSQGGWVAPLAASRSSRVAFCAAVSAAAVPVREQVLHEFEQTVREQSRAPEEVDLALELMQMAFAYGESGSGWEDYLAGVEGAPSSLSGAFPTQRDDWRWSWYRRVLDFDALSAWRQLSVPCLIVYGAEDEHDNVPVAKSVARLESWIDESRRRDVTIRVYPGSGHALGDPATSWIRRDFLADLARWIAANAGAQPR